MHLTVTECDARGDDRSGVGRVARMEFQGKIGNDWRDSEPWWPPLPTPPEGAPNVVLVVLDDVGFAQLGCYGSDIEHARASTVWPPRACG